MAIRTELRVSQKQRLGLTAAIRTSLRVLRLSAEELLDEIAREAAENPFFVSRSPNEGSVAYDYALDRTAAEISLFQSVAQQISTQRLDDRTEAVALALAGELRTDGYLDTDLAGFAQALKIPLALAEQALLALQRCEPAGIGARTLRECLLIQLIDRGLGRPAAEAAISRIDDFKSKRWATLARALRCSRAEIARIHGLLRSLSPAPVPTETLPETRRIPDILLERTGSGQISVTLHPYAVPRVSVMQIDRGVARSDEITGLHRRAVELQAAITARTRTLTRIAGHILMSQKRFFEDGKDSILPASRRDAAAQLGLHPSTFGRAIRGKSIQISGATLPLSLFFQPSLPAADGDVSAYDVQRRIKALILDEDPDRPLADDAICTQLRNEGVDIARRTVAKYRKCMRIPSSFDRKRHNAALDARVSRSEAGHVPDR